MTQTFTIDSIEGNSYIGVPVFSRFGQMQNYNYIVMSPQKKVKKKDKTEDAIVDLENERFKLELVDPEATKKEDEDDKNGETKSGWFHELKNATQHGRFGQKRQSNTAGGTRSKATILDENGQQRA